MHTPVGLYAAHGHQDNADDRAAGMTSKRLHRFVFDRNKKANPHLMQSADYHIYNMVAHQDPYAMPGGTDTQAMIIEEACGLHRKVRCPEIHMACAAPYLYAEDGNSEVSRRATKARREATETVAMATQAHHIQNRKGAAGSHLLRETVVEHIDQIRMRAVKATLAVHHAVHV
eukprot:CAMPEP_0169316392 /NCGR_PEP_ID=MMETSP1017-20121227/6150_1 /TAXON_ID=342587 /ORGANISM="Karlodinium micrum, Strain CCMP2283" /LENGTH=172 /DNA_ID=CAMNT_0009410441 /DNA_START=42 /DNA_END=561 /DNA_ORIENTATION=-